MSQSAELDAPGHYFPLPFVPGVYRCSFCGLVTSSSSDEPCPSRVIPPGRHCPFCGAPAYDGEFCANCNYEPTRVTPPGEKQ